MALDKQPPPPPPPAARRGRKRSEESRTAILAAATELCADVGYAALTIEGIAARAGCGKQTIYRWWPSKAHVLLEALAVKADLFVTTDDHGSYAADLRAFLEASFRLGRRPQVVDVLRALMAQAQVDPGFRQVFRSEFLQRRRAALRLLVDRAAARGDLPARPTPSAALDMVFGVIWYRILATDNPADDELVDELVVTLTSAPTRG